MTQSDRYKGLLLAMCKYHQKIKDEAQEIRDMAYEAHGEEPRLSFGLHRKANLLSERRKAILWMLNRRKPDMVELFGSDVPEVVAMEDFDEDDGLQPVEFVQASQLGVPKRDENGQRIGGCQNWRMAHLDL